jgi:pyrroloquinoline quinone biosynthesis protein B
MRRKLLAIAALVLLALAASAAVPTAATGPELLVLGIAQDGGYPQAGCHKSCCLRAWADPAERRHVASVALLDPESGQRWLIDATPDLREQLRLLDELQPQAGSPGLDGILLTHAHIGHYTGLIHLGREAIGARGVPVYAMPRMRALLAEHGPWSQLVQLGNVELRPLTQGVPVRLGERLSVTPFLVPHRDEYSETVGYHVDGPRRSALYIPDIDKWEKWDRSIEAALGAVDVAYLDGTFYEDGEVPGRNMSEIPHPFIVESLERLGRLAPELRSRVRFIHLNHTNPALQPGSAARAAIETAGFRVAEQLERFEL